MASRTLTAALALMGARVLYRVHEEQKTVEQVQAKGDDGQPLFTTEARPRPGDGALISHQVPVMETVGEGSVHHDRMREFVAFVGRVREDTGETSPTKGAVLYDLLLLSPNRAPVWVDGVVEGDDDEHHSFTLLDGDDVDHSMVVAQVTKLTNQIDTLSASVATLSAAVEKLQNATA